ncbi:MAG: DUF255 domain-containing protein [Candidatus Eisenbacteria bacterium]
MPLRRIRITAFLAAALSLAAALPSFAAVDWRTWDDGLARAKKAKRPVIVDVYTNWCGWCRRMDAEVYGRPDVADYIAGHFVTVKLNAESSETVHQNDRPLTARTLASNYRVTGYPTTIFLDADGGHMTNVPGYVPADKFLLLLRYIGDGHMDRGEKWDDYVKSQGGAK